MIAKALGGDREGLRLPSSTTYLLEGLEERRDQGRAPVGARAAPLRRDLGEGDGDHPDPPRGRRFALRPGDDVRAAAPRLRRLCGRALDRHGLARRTLVLRAEDQALEDAPAPAAGVTGGLGRGVVFPGVVHALGRLYETFAVYADAGSAFCGHCDSPEDVARITRTPLRELCGRQASPPSKPKGSFFLRLQGRNPE